MTTGHATRSARRNRASTTVVSNVIVVGAAFMLASCSDDDGNAGSGDESCPAIATYAGADYDQEQIGKRLVRSKMLGQGTLPDCADTDDRKASDTEVDVWRLKGVAPSVAIGVDEGGTLGLYVATNIDDVCAVMYTRC